MSSEAQLWTMVRKHLSPFGVLHRVEQRSGEGTPDVVYCLKRKPLTPAATGWIELKECEWPKRPGTMFNIPTLTLDQVLFAEFWARAGGRAWLLAQVDKTYLLWTPQEMRKIFEREYTSSEAISAAAFTWLSTKPWPIAQILDQLAGYEHVSE